jgi:F-type H+-transporting ATPase subunit epsilon
VLMAVSGGFMEVLGNQVTVFADTAERAEEIDLARAQEARRRAEASMLRQADALQYAKAEADLRRSLARIKAARLLRKGRSRPPKLPSSP